MPFVLDCSTTMTWIFPDESTDSSEALLESLLDDFADSPPSESTFQDISDFEKPKCRNNGEIIKKRF